MIKRTQLVVGPFQCNCSILVCEKTKEAIIVDAGDEFERIEAEIKKQGLKVKLSVHTHAHLDHIGAVSELKKAHPSTQITLHKADEQIYDNLPMQGQMFGFEYGAPPKVDRFVEHGEVVEFGEQKFEIIHTPGHSPGGICLKFQEGALGETPVVFTGDTLFKESIGRTDLWGGDHRQLIKSIKDRLLSLDGDTRVFPGHGPSSLIGSEAKENPFL